MDWDEQAGLILLALWITEVHGILPSYDDWIKGFQIAS